MSVEDDGNGIVYTQGFIQLQTVTKAEKITISNKTLSIFGVSSNEYAFKGSVSTLKSFCFEENPSLEVIQDYAFYGCYNLDKIDLSMCQNLTTIGSGAFRGCSKVTSLLLPPFLKVAGSYAFYRLKIDSATIPASLTSLQNALFDGCPLKNITFEPGSKVKSFGWRSIANTQLRTLTLPASVSSFPGSALEDTYLDSIKVEEGNSFYHSIDDVLYSISNRSLISYPARKTVYHVIEGVTLIAGSALTFARVQYITLPSTLITIDTYSFSICTALKNITIPKSVLYIKANAFVSCTSMEWIRFENDSSLIDLGVEAFKECKSISEIIIPEKVKNINARCFSGCSKLINVTLPPKIAVLGGGVFNYCHPNISFNFGPNSTIMIDKQNLIMDVKQTTINQYLGSESGASIIIPSTITRIKASAFRGKTNIINITFSGDSLEYIEAEAFYSCSAIKSFNFTPNLISIGEYAFCRCSGLDSIILPPSVRTLGINVFQLCTSVQNVDCGSISTITPSCFYDCTNLKSVQFSDNLFCIGKYCFCNCIKLSEISLPSKISQINESAFSNSGLSVITFAKECKLSFLGELAFINCRYLETIHNFPPSLDSLSVQVFSGSGLKSFTVPNSITKMKDFCFMNCASLESFFIPQDCLLSSIGNGVFEGCKALRFISAKNEYFSDEYGALFTKQRDQLIIFPPSSTIRFFSFPSNVQTISYGAFFGCINLKHVMIPESSMRVIGQRAFEGCSNINTINIPISIEFIGKDAFKGCSHINCGQTVDITSATLMKQLIIDGKFPARALKQCGNTCKNPIYRIRLSLISAFILVLSQTH